MKRVLIITTQKKLLLYLVYLTLSGVIVFIAAMMHSDRHSQVFSNSESMDIPTLEKENSKLKGVLSSILPEKQEIIYEDEYRNIYKNAGIIPPLPMPAAPLSEVIAQGEEKKFKIFSNDPQYLRPVYDPSWKEAYFRGWLYLPHKNIEARHRIFAFSLGGSANFDITGSLGLRLETPPNTPLDNHHNINFLVYGFDVKSVKVFQNQVALTGNPSQSGVQIVSIVQNDLLPEGTDTKNFLFQLSTAEGYEVDFLYHNIIRYEYLMEKIKEHTVQASSSNAAENEMIEKLIRENTALKQELSFFIPLQEEMISQQSCASTSNTRIEISEISAAIKQGKELLFNCNYNQPQYRRPLYHPQWKMNYRSKWCYIPDQIEYGLHRLFAIPENRKARYNLFGILGFNENYQPLQQDQYGFLIYCFDVSKTFIHKNRILLIGTPSRTGVQILAIGQDNIKGYDSFLVSLITPDHSEIDCMLLRTNYIE